ncbi:MAG TPA: universal stress protein [Thermomicrobiaceae bacterium]|nr:universal stress protein [Thermomicrobiaceae bacterium]
MMETAIASVVVPLDGSPLAAQALPIAAAVAGRAGCPLHLVRVLDHGVPAETERRAEQALQETAAGLGADAQPQLHLRLGEAADQILAQAAALPDPLVIMTTHGRTGIGRWAFGSVADRVVRGGEAPVLLLRSGLAPAEITPPFRTVLVPLDGSALAEAALPQARALARLFAAELHLVRVAETARLFMAPGMDAGLLATDLTQQLVDELEREARDYLEPVAARTRADGLTVVSAVVDGIPVEALLAYASTHAVDLIVLATHGRGGFNRLVLGSVAERLLRLAPTPVLMVPAAALDEVPLAEAGGAAEG